MIIITLDYSGRVFYKFFLREICIISSVSKRERALLSLNQRKRDWFSVSSTRDSLWWEITGYDGNTISQKNEVVYDAHTLTIDIRLFPRRRNDD